MPRHVSKPLTVKGIASLKKRGNFCDGGGLYLQVSPGGTKSWLFRFELNGRKRDMGLGSLDTFNLAEARDRARKMRQQVADGIDPIEARNAARGTVVKVLTFKQCAELYIAANEAGWKPDTLRQWQSSLPHHVYPVLGKVAIADVDMSLVTKVLDPIWNTKTVTAKKVQNRIELILAWAKARGHRSGENPAQWRGHLDSVYQSPKKVAPVEHRAALPYRDMSAFMVELRKLTDTAASATDFMILTAVRANEATGARWDEIKMDERLWIIPPERMKGEKGVRTKPHRVPLSDAAMAVVERQAAAKVNDFVFPGTVPGTAINAQRPNKLLAKLGHKDITAHGFRSAFKDWAAEVSKFPREIAEASLAHEVGDAVEQAYGRGDFIRKRAALMQAWANYIAKTPATTADVVPLRRVS